VSKLPLLALNALMELVDGAVPGCLTVKARAWHGSSLVSVLLLSELPNGVLTPRKPPSLMPLLQDCCERQAMLLLGCVFSSSVVLCLFTLGAKDRLIVAVSSILVCNKQFQSLLLHA
jgi:hypothetical protein